VKDKLDHGELDHRVRAIRLCLYSSLGLSFVCVVFCGITVYFVLCGNYSFALGLLGPALATLAGAWGFKAKADRLMVGVHR
jgi:hypothetical protein